VFILQLTADNSSWGKNGGSVKLTTHHHLENEVKKRFMPRRALSRSLILGIIKVDGA
jgi:hypothetical protein